MDLNTLYKTHFNAEVDKVSVNLKYFPIKVSVNLNF